MSLTNSTLEMGWWIPTIGLLVIYSLITTTLIILSSKRDLRKERLITRLNQKVLEYRVGIQQLNAITRQEKQDDSMFSKQR